MVMPKKIIAPSEQTNGRVLRGIAKGVIGTIPGIGSLATEAAELIFPNPEASDRAEWEVEVSGLLNWLTDNLGVYRIPTTKLAWRIGRLFWQRDEEAKGRVDIDESIIYEVFPDENDRAIDEAIAEIVDFEWCEGWSNANHRSGYGGFRLKPNIFACLDPIERGNSPSDDAVRIAKELLETTEEAVSAEQIDHKFGWERRRLYPALWLLSEYVVPPPFNEGQIESYPVSWFYLSGSNRHALRKFVARY